VPAETHPKRFAFLGPRGTYAEEALRALAPADVEALPCPSVRDTVMAVQSEAVERAVVPIENSLEGSVTATLDTLATEARDVRIAAELALPIRHCLIAREGVGAGDVERVVSHPQALAQCARYLRERMPRAQTGAAASTADGVRQVAGSEAPWAALGSRVAAEAYGCAVLAEGVEDHHDNLTRFVLLAPAAGAAEGAGERRAAPLKTSIVFFGFNDVSPGALVAVLGELSSRGINLTKIESRPRRLGLGHYMFFADLEGGEREPHVAEALGALRARVETLHVLGSYPSAPDAPEEVPR
jgi:prephenate dehydratase